MSEEKTAAGLIRFVQSDLETFVNNPAIKDEYKESVSQLFRANKVLLDRALELMLIEKLIAVNEVL